MSLHCLHFFLLCFLQGPISLYAWLIDIFEYDQTLPQLKHKKNLNIV